jgi:hypothetical protein
VVLKLAVVVISKRRAVVLLGLGGSLSRSGKSTPPAYVPRGARICSLPKRTRSQKNPSNFVVLLSAIQVAFYSI